MGTDGMSYSLQSRDLIADSIETVMGAQWYDACIAHPRLRQEHARLPDGDGPPQPPRASWSTAARSAPAARRDERTKLDIVSAFQVLRRIHRRQDHRRRAARDRPPQPAPAPAPAAACTPPTRWPRPSKRMGMSLPYSSSIPAEDPRQARRVPSRRRGDPHLLENDLKPRDIMTRAGVRKRDGDRHGARRLDQRRAAL